MTWSTVILSTADSIARFEANVNSLTDDDWDSKIDIAKDLVRDEIYLFLDTPGDIDDISNTEVFEMASDYLTLHLIYSDISKGQTKGGNVTKAEKYFNLYRSKIRTSLKVLKSFSADADSTNFTWSSGELSR